MFYITVIFTLIVHVFKNKKNVGKIEKKRLKTRVL